MPTIYHKFAKCPNCNRKKNVNFKKGDTKKVVKCICGTAIQVEIKPKDFSVKNSCIFKLAFVYLE